MGKPLSLQELAALVGASAAGLPPEQFVTGTAPLDAAGPDDVSFLEGADYLVAARKSAAGVILTRERFEPTGATLMLVDRPREAFARCLAHFHEAPRDPAGTHPSAVVDPSASLGEGVSVGPLCCVGEGATIGARTVLGAGVLVGARASVGADCRLHRGAILGDGVRLGDRVVVQSGSVVGSDGFGYLQQGGKHHKIVHAGTVILEDDVELGAGCCVDRATSGATVVGAGTKIDNLVHIAHNVRIGRNCLIVAQVGISGSVTIGDGVILAGKAGVAGHLEIGDGAVVGAAAGVVRSVPAGATVAGWPAMEVGLWRRSVALVRRLPRLWDRLLALEQAVARAQPAVERRDDEDPSYGDR